MAWHKEGPIVDLGNVVCEDDLLEQAQQHCSDVIATALKSTPVITLGGGHEVAWASFNGLAQYLQQLNPSVKPKIGVINFDAHFDLRTFESSQHDVKPSSGTPFCQIHHFCQQHEWPFHYACLGVSAASNTQALLSEPES